MFDIITHPYFLKKMQTKNLFVSYIPMYKRKETHKRGYNQAKILAEALATLLQVPCVSLCVKTKATVSQASLSRIDRLQNMKEVFAYVPDSSHSFVANDGSTAILLVDDVLTTGATMENCAATIKKHMSNVHIRGLCVARHTI